MARLQTTWGVSSASKRGRFLASGRNSFKAGLTFVVGLLAWQLMCEARASESVPIKITSHSPSNIFVSKQARLKLSVDGATSFKTGEIRVSDEKNHALQVISLPPGEDEFEFDLPSKGYYSISVTLSLSDGRVIKTDTSAAVIGVELPDETRRQSQFGLWRVHGDLQSVLSAGAGWARQMWTLNNYQQGVDGKSVPHSFPLPKNNELRSRFNWIGVLAHGLPPWLSKNHAAHRPYDLQPPDDWARLSELVETFVRDVPNFPPFFEIYNEPENSWKGTDGELVHFLRVIAKAIKKVHPETQVLVPGFATIDIPRLRRLVDLGLFDGMDGLVLHAYDAKGSKPEGGFIQRVIELKRFLAEQGKIDFPIFFTEFGWTSKLGTWQPPVDELTQAQYVARSLVLLKEQRIKAAIYFCLLYKAKKEGEAGFSLLHREGTPKPGFVAYANVMRWLVGAADGGRILKVAPQGNLALFKKGINSIAVAWAEKSDAKIYLPLLPNEVMEDMMGRPLSVNDNQLIELTPSPIFLSMKDAAFSELTVADPIRVSRGGKTRLPLTELFLPHPLRVEEGTLVVPEDTAIGRYLLFGKVSGKWQALPVEVY